MTVATAESQKTEVQVADEAKAQETFKDPYEYLATFPGAPTKEQVEALKAQAPNGIIRIFAPGKRVFLLRGFSGVELQSIQAQIPENLGANLAPDARAAKIEAEVGLHAASLCTVWTSTTKSGKLTIEQLRGGTAGLPSTLFAIVTYMSDFLDPEALQALSMEL